MNTKAKLLKAAAICSYVFTALWFVVAACFFALSNNLYWMFAVFALITLYDGFVIMSIRDNMNSAEFNEKQNITLLVCGILCVLSPVSLVLCEIAYLGKFEDKIVSDKIATATKAETTAETTKKAFFRKPSFIVMCCALVAIFLFSFAAMCFETSGFSVSVSDFTLTREMTLSYNEGKIHGKQYVIGEETDVDGNDNDVCAKHRHRRKSRARCVCFARLYAYQGDNGAVLHRTFSQRRGGVYA